MPTINFQDVFNTLSQGITKLAEATVTGYASQAESVGQDFLNQLKSDLQTWTEQLAGRQLPKADFIDLVEGQQDLLKMAALKQIGVTEIDLDNFKNGVFSLIENTIFSLI